MTYTVNAFTPGQDFKVVSCRKLRWLGVQSGRPVELGFQGGGFCALLDGKALTFSNSPCRLATRRNMEELLKAGLNPGFKVMDVRQAD